MSCSQNNFSRKNEAVCGNNSLYLPILQYQLVHTGLKMHLSTGSQYLFTNIFNNSGQLIGTYMRMSICQNRS